MEFVKIDGLYQAAKNAYSGISFDPEKRATSIVEDYEKELNDNLKEIPEVEHERYIDGYKRYLFAWLSAKSRCLSPMITGPANFPTERNRKANISEHKRLEEFIEWRKKAISAIKKKEQAAKSPGQIIHEELEHVIKEINQKLEFRSTALCCSMIERMAYKGQVEKVECALNLIREFNKTHSHPFVTERNKVWTYLDVAKKVRERIWQKKQDTPDETTINGIRIVADNQEERVRIFFDGKPAEDVISLLKKNAFKWSPMNKCWQRLLTQNAKEAAVKIVRSTIKE